MKKITERVQETVKLPPELLVERPPFPNKLKIELTAQCNLKCYFCSLTYKPRKKGDIEEELLFKIIREAKDLGVKDLGLFWLGEPMLVRELPRYVAYAKEAGIPYVFITTNGLLATPERMRPLLDSGIDSIKFSFNASNSEKYRQVTAVDGFDRVVENIRLVWELRGDRRKPLLFASTVCDSTEEFEAAGRLIGSFVDEHYCLRRYGAQASQEQKAPTLESRLPCWSLFTEPHISYDGYMSACFCDHDPKFYMGNLREMSLLEAWHSAQFTDLRRHHLAKNVSGTSCQDCIAYSH